MKIFVYNSLSFLDPSEETNWIKTPNIYFHKPITIIAVSNLYSSIGMWPLIDECNPFLFNVIVPLTLQIDEYNWLTPIATSVIEHSGGQSGKNNTSGKHRLTPRHWPM